MQAARFYSAAGDGKAYAWDLQRGEVVVLVRGFDPAMVTLTPETAQLLARLADELPPRRAAAVVADITGLPARQLYQWLLDRRNDS